MNELPLEERIIRYCDVRNAIINSRLGTGTQGSVFEAKNPSQRSSFAVKFHNRQVAYFRERDVFLRLQDLNIDEVQGHQVPILLGYDDNLLAIEMTIVCPPFCLDFGGAFLDQRPDYSPEVWRDWREQKSEEFDDDWPAVLEILDEFESFGVFIADVNPGNIKFS